MKKLSVLFTILFLFTIILKAQTSKDSETNAEIVQAKYLKEDLDKLLAKNTIFPIEAFKNKIQGDVIVSITIDKNGNLDNLDLVSSANKIFSSSAIVAFDNVENEWSSCQVDGVSVSKTYLIVFRYRLYENALPPSDKKIAEKLVKKEKYKKALKYYNRLISDNQYDYEFFEMRSKVKEKLGDSDGALMDTEQASRLKNEIISLVNIEGLVKIRTVTKVERRTRY